MSSADAPSTPEHPLWYTKELTRVAEPARKLLEQYSGIKPDDVVPHILAVRDRAWDVFPYPCIGMFRFLDLSIPSLPYYNEIITRLKSGQKFLDLGCCFGQELRQLAADGVPSENLYGSDLRMDFMDLGYDLFLDREKLQAAFIPADIFDANSPLGNLDGQLDIIHTGSFFHLFGREEQVQIAIRVIKLLRPVPGSLVVGRQVGNQTPGEYARRFGQGSRYRHDAASWELLWKEAGDLTGTKWHVEARLDESDAIYFAREDFRAYNPEGTRRLRFTVRRLVS